MCLIDKSLEIIKYIKAARKFVKKIKIFFQE